MEFILLIIAVIVLSFTIASILIIRIFLPKQIIKELENYENTLAGRQFEEIKNTYHEMRGWRHDYKNHMQVLKIYLENRQWDECI